MGALAAGILADRLSRRRSILFACGTAFLSCQVSTTQLLDLGSGVLCRINFSMLCQLPFHAHSWSCNWRIRHWSVKVRQPKATALFALGLTYSHGSMLSPLYIGEISAPESRGALLALEQLGIVSNDLPMPFPLAHSLIRSLVLSLDSGLGSLPVHVCRILQYVYKLYP